MRIKKFTITPVEQQGLWEDEISQALEGAVHVETYTQSCSGCGENRILIIYAFFPDSKELISKKKWWKFLVKE